MWASKVTNHQYQELIKTLERGGHSLKQLGFHSGMHPIAVGKLIALLKEKYGYDIRSRPNRSGTLIYKLYN